MRVIYTLPLIITSALAAPAIIWKKAGGKAKQEQTLHINKYTDASNLIKDVVSASTSVSSHAKDSTTKSSLACVIFLIGRDEQGNEGLSHLGQNGKLPETKKRYEDAESVFYNVDNLESQHTVAKDAKKGLMSSSKNKDEVLHVSLDELISKLESMEKVEAEVSATGEVITNKARRKRTKALENASVLIVHAGVDENISSLDLAMSSSIDHGKVGSTILAGIRSTDEVKRARKLISKMQTRKFSNRRLEDAGDDDANADYSGVYYVNMTPNIFAGLLYMFLFTFVTYLGVGCMVNIQGQDVYVDKMPSIGREA